MRPLSVNVIQTLDTSDQGTTLINITISDLAWVAFFFLLRPGEYYKGGTDTTHHLFLIKDAQLFIVYKPYNTATAPNIIFSRVDFVSLLFMTQNNGAKGKLIGHGRTGHPQGGLVAIMRH